MWHLGAKTRNLPKICELEKQAQTPLWTVSPQNWRRSPPRGESGSAATSARGRRGSDARMLACSPDLRRGAMLSIGASRTLEIILPLLQSSAAAVSQAESVAAVGGPRAKILTVSWFRTTSPLRQSKQKPPKIALTRRASPGWAHTRHFQVSSGISIFLPQL